MPVCGCVCVCACVFSVFFWRHCSLFPSVTGLIEDSFVKSVACCCRNLCVSISIWDFCTGFLFESNWTVVLWIWSIVHRHSGNRWWLCETQQHVAMLIKKKKIIFFVQHIFWDLKMLGNQTVCKSVFTVLIQWWVK